MSNDLTDRAHLQEAEYFRRKDLELIEKIRQTAAAKAAQDGLGHATGLSDASTLSELLALGFTPDTVNLLPLVPVLQVAWAEGGVTSIERDQLLQLAGARGITSGSPSYERLTEWLTTRPSDAIFSGAGRLISAMLATGAPQVANLSAADLVQYCESIASASGGFFGLIGRVSAEEKQLLTSIASELKGRPATGR